MPEFIADTFGTVDGIEWRDLSPFVQGYLECLLFTETSCIPMVEWHSEESQQRVAEGQADGNIPADAGFCDFHPDALAQAHSDCSAFEAKARHLLSQAYAKEGYDRAAAGRDFWFTRNGHGTGFWDRGLGDIGDDLSDIARTFGEVDPWFSEAEEPDSPTGYGFIYFM